MQESGIVNIPILDLDGLYNRLILFKKAGLPAFFFSLFLMAAHSFLTKQKTLFFFNKSVDLNSKKSIFNRPT